MRMSLLLVIATQATGALAPEGNSTQQPIAKTSEGRRKLTSDWQCNGHGTQNTTDGECTCNGDWLPSGKAMVAHHAKHCNPARRQGDANSGLDECGELCNCNYVTLHWAGTSFHSEECSFSRWTDYGVYVSLWPNRLSCDAASRRRTTLIHLLATPRREMTGRCKSSDAETCSGHGAAQSDGSCTCGAGFWSADCSATCTPGFRAGGCNGRGVLRDDGACECEQGWLPSGQEVGEHAGKYCSTTDGPYPSDASQSGHQRRIAGELRSDISTAEECKQACAADAGCSYAHTYPSGRCYVSSERDLHPSSHATTYVSWRAQSAVAGRFAPSARPRPPLFLPGTR